VDVFGGRYAEEVAAAQRAARKRREKRKLEKMEKEALERDAELARERELGEVERRRREEERKKQEEQEEATAEVDGVYRGTLYGEQFSLTIRNEAVVFVAGKVSIRGSVDAAGAIKAAYSGVLATMDMSAGDAPDIATLRGTMIWTGKVKEGRASGMVKTDAHWDKMNEAESDTSKWSATRVP